MISSEMFPFESFSVRLEHTDEKKICWFKDDYDLQKYLERYKLDKRTIKIDYRDGEPVVRSKKHKGSVEQKSKSKSNRSTSSVSKRKPSVDSSGNTSRTTKRKK
jgi:hypothetical protein